MLPLPMPIQELQPGFTRLAMLLPEKHKHTPGSIAKLTGAEAEVLGPITIISNQAFIDVLSDQSTEVRDRLAKHAPIQLLQKTHNVLSGKWTWLKLSIGRNHGLTINQLKTHCARAQLDRLGKIHIQNTHALLGIPQDHLEQAIHYFSKKTINGYRPRPAPPEPQPRGDPRFSK